jgi:outer membrane autotransporter protein
VDGNFDNAENPDFYSVDKNGDRKTLLESIAGYVEERPDGFSESLWLSMTRTATDFSDYDGLTPNQRSLANLLDMFYNEKFPNLDPEQQDAFVELYNEFFATLYDGDVPNNLGAASGEGHTSEASSAQSAARRFMEQLLQQLQQQGGAGNTQFAARKAPRLVYNGTRYAQLLGNTAAPANAGVDDSDNTRSNIWATIGRASDNVDNDANNTGYDFNATEYQVGYSRVLSPRTVLGLSIGKSEGRFDANDSNVDGDSDTTSFGAALRHDSGKWYATGGITYNRHDIQSKRDLGGTEYDGDTKGRTIEVSGEVGRKMVRGGWRIDPNLTFNLANTRIDGFQENGGAGALNVGQGRYNTRRIGLGVRIASNKASARFRPYLSAAYQREFGDRQVELNNTLAGIGAFDVEGTELGRNIWKLRLGTDARITNRFTLIGEIGGQWRKNQDSQYVYGGVKYSW